MTDAIKPTKFAVSYLIFHPEDSAAGTKTRRFAIVQRPATDADLPNKWGLPAGMHVEPTEDNSGRSWEESVRISGLQKLGITLEPVQEISEGIKERAGYFLRMKQFEAEVRDVKTEVATTTLGMVCPQPVEGVTQYQQWKWGTAADLHEAALSGSLCSQLYLKHR